MLMIVLYYNAKNVKDTITKVKDDLLLLSQWCNKNRLTIKSKKKLNILF